MTRDNLADPSKNRHAESQKPTDGDQLPAENPTSGILSLAMNNLNVTSDNDSDQSQEPFHIVLVDIEKTTRLRNGICCVSKPLDDKDIKFVAISYRWGEVQEQVVDTGVGYMASITAFHLHDFHTLCYMITQEPDLQSVEYLWVDAICVDQSNHARRKATIYQMSNIYERANYILAVPDFHLRYLRNVNIVNKEVLDNVKQYDKYIYHLIHNNVDQLRAIDDEWFNKQGIPQDSAPRQELAKYKSRFMGCLEEYNNNHNATSKGDAKDTFVTIVNDIYNEDSNLRLLEGSDCNRCNNQTCICELERTLASENGSIPYEQLHSLLKRIKNDLWKQQMFKRSKEVRQAMDFLTGLLTDWSSRVWVISEFHIAKNKRSSKLKYWFMLLNRAWIHFEEFRFFEFDFDNPTVPTLETWAVLFQAYVDCGIFQADIICEYEHFHTTMMQNLNQQSFLEMMLKSKASKNEDRFYAILPNSNYKHTLVSKDVVSYWNITDIVSVKLKLYEIMSIKDKLLLLFYTANSSGSTSDFSLPMFATIDIVWTEDNLLSASSDDTIKYNFDLANDATLQLIRPNASDNGHKNGRTAPRYKLNLTPNMFYIHCNDEYVNSLTTFISSGYERLIESWDVDWHTRKTSVVRIPLYADGIRLVDERSMGGPLHLIGSFENNKWLIFGSHWFTNTHDEPWEAQDNNNGNVSFDIY